MIEHRHQVHCVRAGTGVSARSGDSHRPAVNGRGRGKVYDLHAVATRRGAFPTELQIYFCEGHRQRRIAALLREFDGGTRKPRPRRTGPAAGIEAGGDVPLRHLRPVQQRLDARQRHPAEQSRRDIRRIKRWYLQETTCISQVFRPDARQAFDL